MNKGELWAMLSDKERKMKTVLQENTKVFTPPPCPLMGSVQVYIQEINDASEIYSKILSYFSKMFVFNSAET